MTSSNDAPPERVTTLELFFDLVFVFTITQLTALLTEDASPGGLLRVLLLLCVIWWMYGGYAWLTNAVAPDRAARRLLLLAGMGGFLVLALSIPRAFGDGGVAFGLAYLVVVGVHVALFTKTYSVGAARAILRTARYNLISALLVLGAGVLATRSGPAPAVYALWLAAVAVEGVTPFLGGLGGYEIAPAHFVERHGLVVLVALGESVVAIGIGAAGHPVDVTLAALAVLGLLLSAGLWWMYFGGDDARAERALTAAPAARRPRMAIVAFGYWHLPILLGVIAAAAGMEAAIGHPYEPLAPAMALALAGGVALFLAGDVLFRRSLEISGSRWRTGAAVLIVATAPVGVFAPAVVQLIAVVVLLGACVAGEARAAPSPAGSAARGLAPAGRSSGD